VSQRGTELWSHKVETPIYAPLGLAGDVILVAGQNGLIYGLDSKRGRGLWSFDSRAKEE
jgi:outer membrane protein assembly factor BamB